MSEPAKTGDCAVDDEIEKHGGAWAAVAALLEQRGQLELQLEGAWALVSSGYARRGGPAFNP